MKKFVVFAMVLLLVSCAPSQRDPSEIREGTYGSLSATVTAHYIDRSVTFILDCVSEGSRSSVTVKEPAEIAGIVVTVDENRAVSYDGVSVEAGTRNVLSPAEFLPFARSLWIGAEPAECGYEKAGEIDCMVITHKSGDALYRTWFATGDLRPVAAELITGETRTIYCEFENVPQSPAA